jgi:hypothetical protein
LLSFSSASLPATCPGLGLGLGPGLGLGVESQGWH